MPLEPRVAALIAAMEETFPPVDLTKSGTRVRLEVKAAGERVIPTAVEEVGEVSDRTMPGPGGPIPVRVYRPLAPAGEPVPLVVFFHGGGWTVCDLDSHDGICRALCNASGCALVAVDYRLAPEHPFPAAVEDAYAATCWLAENARSLGCDPRRLAVVGDSAGGNIAAVVAMMARDRGGPELALQALVYPVIDHSDQTVSHRENGSGYALRSAEVMYYWGQYLARPGDGADPYASPIRAEDLSGLARALVVTGEYDPLRDEGEAYGERLRAAGVPVRVHRYEGMFHSFFSFLAVLDEARQLRDEIASELRDAFALSNAAC
jgi:acetyl esterase